MAKKIKATKPLKQLVGVLEGGSDPSRGEAGNPVKKRSSFTTQQISAVGAAKVDYQGMISGARENATLTVTVGAAALPTHTGDTLILGDYELIEHVHWAVAEADVAATQTALVTAIDNLKGFSAVAGAGAGEVDVTGPTGPESVKAKLISRTGNLSLSTADGYMSKGGPKISGPKIT